MSTPPLQHSPAAERNQGPILAQLLALLPPTGTALEIASGTGQHAAHFAAALPGWTWQPTDLHDTHFGSITGWATQADARNVQEPRRLDVLHDRWPSEGPAFGAASFDLVYCANMLHIAPWACCGALMRGAAHWLAPGGQLITYGPYFVHGEAPAPGNTAFDADLRARNPAWGLRWLHAVQAEAAAAGLHLAERVGMPANNLLLAWRR